MDYTKEHLNICVVDDEEILRVTIAGDLKDMGHSVIEFDNPAEALNYIKSHSKIEVVITDIKMPGMSGLQLLQEIKKINHEICVIVITAYGTVKSAVKAIKFGAFDYLTKPFEPEELKNLINKIAEINCLRHRNKEFSEHFRTKYSISSYFGESDHVKKTKENIKLVADSNSTILITGETGTGKELLANIIHYNSNRRKKPMVKVSCAILSKDVFESELFGHTKGAFTGADKERIGRFEEADGGTLYLDDIDDIPLELQVKLLRVLQEKEIEKVGSNKTIKIDVRVIASTKANLMQLVKEGKFREDLYYRINIFPINLIPLRKRKDDIPILFNEFLKVYSQGKKIVVENNVLELLLNYDWPGNTRELKNLVERLVILSRNNIIDKSLIPSEITSPNFANLPVEMDKNLVELVRNVEITAIKNALEEASGNKNKAADILGIPISTLRSKMEKYDLF